MKWRLVMLAAPLLFASCTDSYEDQQAALNKFVSKNRIGSAADVWLVKHNFFGEWEKVTLVFGFIDDFDFCQEIADLYMRKHPADQYSCLLAN